MSLQKSFSDLVTDVANLNFDEYEKFITMVNTLRVQQRPDSPSKKESDLLSKINRGFPTENWQRMQYLDSKMETSKISELEYAELTSLTETYEKYCVQRIRLLKKLALLRNISLEEAINQLGVKHGKA